MVVAGKFTQARTAYMACQVAPLVNLGHAVPDAVQDNRRHSYDRQNWGHVYFPVHPHNFYCRARTSGLSEIAREGLTKLRIGCLAVSEDINGRGTAPFPF